MSKIKLTLTLCLIVILSACTSLYKLGSQIPGIDRIFYPQSNAEIGPVKTLEDEIVAQAPEPPELTKEQATVYAQEPTKQTTQSHEDNSEKTQSNISTTTRTDINAKTPAPTQVVKQTITTEKLASIEGRVKLLDATGEISPEGVIVQIRRVDGIALERRNQVPTSAHEIDMKDKVYLPANLVVNAGEELSFLNKDNIQHNVFSSSGKNAFDLGTYGAGLKRSVRFQEEGIVKVYCNIHPDMATYVAVDDGGISQVIDESATFSFSDLPLTEYEIRVWSIRGEMTRRVRLDDEATQLLLELDTSGYQAPTRANKFGKAYQQSTGQLDGEYF